MSASPKLRVAIVGCGIGRGHLTEGYLTNPDLFDVVTLCDIDADRLAEVADEHDIAGRNPRFQDVLAMDDVDVIDICTPPRIHCEQVVAALRAGKHVICEKPLAGSLAEVDRIIEAERSAAGRLMPIFQYRFGDGIGQARAIIEAGIAGKPYLGTVETQWKRTPAYYEVPWRGRWETELGGVLVGHAIHTHDLALSLMGPVSRLFGRIATRVNDIEVEDCASASCLLESGALLSLSATLGSQEEISRLRLCFENVTFESDHAPYRPGEKPWRIISADNEVRAKIDALLADWVHIPSRFATQMALFHEAVTTGGALPVTSADARAALEVITAFYHSADQGVDVTLPIGPDHPKYASWRPTV